MKDIKAFRILSRCIHLIRMGALSLRAEGVALTAYKVAKVLGFFGMNRVSCRRWAKTPQFTEEELESQRNRTFDRDIVISIITPLYNTREEFLREMIESVQNQTYAGWELCMADGSDGAHAYVGEVCLEYALHDERIKYRRLEKNLGIAGNSNACIDMATGDYISLLDHDDILHPAALHEVMEVICAKSVDIIYTDELIFRSPDLEDITRVCFKPDFAPDNLRASNYICHFTSFNKSLMDACGGFRAGFDGAQDHDLMLRLTAKANVIEHIPEVLYYWRSHGESTAETANNKPYASASGIKAVRSSLEAAGISGDVIRTAVSPTLYHVSYALPDPLPKVSIIIPNYEHVDDLRKCITSIIQKSTYTNYEVIVVENNSKDTSIFRFYEEIMAESERIKVVTWHGQGFNWSALNNFGVTKATGDYIMLLNNDTEVITPQWIEEMLMHAQRLEVGVVGAMLYYPNDTIQHAGVILGLGGTLGYAFRKAVRGYTGYMLRLCYAQNLSAVTGACMLMRREVFEEVGGIDETLAVAYNDIDLCMKMRRKGYLVVWTPFAELYHYESKTRGSDDTVEKRALFKYEEALFMKRWAAEMAAGDPYYNPNLSIDNGNFEIKIP